MSNLQFDIVDFERLAEQHAVKRDDIKTVNSKPYKRGIIRVQYFCVGNTYHIFDDSDNSSGYQKVDGKDVLKKVLKIIEMSA